MMVKLFFEKAIFLNFGKIWSYMVFALKASICKIWS